MSVFTRLYDGQTNYPFIPRWRIWFAISGVVVLAGTIALFTNGLNLGIDFKGGVAWEVPAGKASVAEVRDKVAAAGITDPNVQRLGSKSAGDVIRVQAETVGKADSTKVTELLSQLTGAPVTKVSYDEVGPSWGGEITHKAERALVVFLVLVTAFIAVRFEWRMALATLVALVHDVLVTVGIFAIFQFQVTPATVVAFLTILGYSIYDGIVVFDRVDEDARSLAASGSMTYSNMVNGAMNHVLMRTLNTSITAVIPIASLLVVGSAILGASTLQDFGLALFIGLVSGAYSSIFIASPTLALLKEREPRWANLRRRLESKGPAAAAAPALVGAGAGFVDVATRTEPERPIRSVSEEAAIRARARKKGKRR
ncbi:MAG TPA: protein translocase subunit SecF [Acidimicrobiales bacterium]|jgi:preprotein translocase subunit SecF